MFFVHPDRPGVGVRLSYGLNLYPSRDAAGVLAGLRELSVPLRERLAPQDREFGVGAWLPARAAREFLADETRLEELCELLGQHGLDACTFNAFPHGDFHGPGLKERVFSPSWLERARLDFTRDVAHLAARVRARRGGSRAGEHLSISTHAGAFAASLRPGDRERLALSFIDAAAELAAIEDESGERIVLSLEPEPRSSSNDTRELSAFLAEVRARARGSSEAAAWRHLGACLDTCHAAVEFEEPAEAFARATAQGTALGKLQFSSALSLTRPDEDEAGRARFLGLDEPVYLHQVTGRRGGELVRATDIGEIRREPQPWRGCDEWRCHFHVPVDLARLGGTRALATTRALAEETLRAALAGPERWGTRELHVEVETYTWNLFSPAETGAASVLEGLARELTHARGVLGAAGWSERG